MQEKSLRRNGSILLRMGIVETVEKLLLNPFAGLAMALVLVVIGWKLNTSVSNWVLILAWIFFAISIFRTPPISQQVFIQRALWTMLFSSVIGLGLCALAGWQPNKVSESKSATPSFLFVLGAPLGDNNSSIWIMMLQHYGPKPTYNCDVHFYDKDRKNIEHMWLVANPTWPFPPPGIAGGESQKYFHFAEAGPSSPVGNFQWSPIDPNRQHYSVSIVCRDGVFEETWDVTRVDGVLRTKITLKYGPDWVKKYPHLSPVVFTCTDPEFIDAPLATKLSQGPPLVHPGWKPSHKFSVPVAIIDSNHNVQMMSGIAMPGGQKTDFGCWNLLTKHLGDEKS